jgi:hypothetical protein
VKEAPSPSGRLKVTKNINTLEGLAHGPLMVCGFLGTLIGVERAVALGVFWPYAAPLLTAAGTLALLTGLPAPPLMMLGSLGLVAIFVVIMRRQCALATGTMALGALLWLVGNAYWLVGWPVPQIVPWWSGFLVLTIAGALVPCDVMWLMSNISGRYGCIGS